MWDEEYMIEVLNPSAYIHVVLFEGENQISEIRFSLMEIAEKDFLEDWFTLEDGSTKVKSPPHLLLSHFCILDHY
jgi:hypothetical protein